MEKFKKDNKIIQELKKEILKIEKENLYIHRAGIKEKLKKLIKSRVK